MRRGRVGHRERRERFGRLGEQRQRFAGDCGFRNGVPGPWARIPVSGAAARAAFRAQTLYRPNSLKTENSIIYTTKGGVSNNLLFLFVRGIVVPHPLFVP